MAVGEKAKDVTLTVTSVEKATLMTAMELQQKSFERAARATELQGKQAIAAAIRDELKFLVNLKSKIDNAQ